MTSDQKPAVDQVSGAMRKTIGSIPSVIEKATAFDEGLLDEHLRSRAYAIPAKGALDEETRTLIYLASALAGSSKACIQAMANKAKMQGIAPETYWRQYALCGPRWRPRSSVARSRFSKRCKAPSKCAVHGENETMTHSGGAK